MVEQRLRLGQLLVDASIISQEQLDECLLSQKQDGRKLGTLLVERGFINETQLTQILSQQLSVPWVSLYHVDFSKRLLSLVPRDVAEKFCLVPIYVRHVRGQGDTLYVAMDDPTNDEALKACSMWSGLPTRAMIASPSDIRDAIRVYYGEGRKSVPPPAESKPAEPAPTVRQASKPVETPKPTQAPEPVVEPKPSPEPIAEPSEPEPPVDSVPPTPEAASAWKAPGETQQAPEGAAQGEPSNAADQPQAEPAPESARALDAGTLEGASAEPEPPKSEEQITLEVGEELPIEAVLPEGRAIPRKKPMTGAERLMSLTLLDGTQLALPVRRLKKAALREQAAARREPSAPPSAPRSSQPPTRVSQPPTEIRPAVDYTARDLIAALRASAHGVDAAELLGQEPQWQSILAALVALMLRRGLIDEQELIDELNKV